MSTRSISWFSRAGLVAATAAMMVLCINTAAAMDGKMSITVFPSGEGMVTISVAGEAGEMPRVQGSAEIASLVGNLDLLDLNVVKEISDGMLEVHQSGFFSDIRAIEPLIGVMAGNKETAQLSAGNFAFDEREEGGHVLTLAPLVIEKVEGGEIPSVGKEDGEKEGEDESQKDEKEPSDLPTAEESKSDLANSQPDDAAPTIVEVIPVDVEAVVALEADIVPSANIAVSVKMPGAVKSEAWFATSVLEPRTVTFILNDGVIKCLRLGDVPCLQVALNLPENGQMSVTTTDVAPEVSDEYAAFQESWAAAKARNAKADSGLKKE